MESSFFYTFSTIAQTLAGAIALLAAFVLYRLQSLNAEIESIGERLAIWVAQISQSQHEVGENARRLFSRGQYNDLLGVANRIEVPASFYPATLERERLAPLLEGKVTLLWRFGFALYLTAGLIAFSVLMLTVTPRIAAYSWACWVLSGAAIWFAACLLSYLWLLLKVFR